MKKITTFLGCVGVVCLFWGCSSDSDLLSPENTLADNPAITPADNNPANISSSSTQQAPVSSSSVTDTQKPNPTTEPGNEKPDSIIVTKPVVVIQDPNLGDIPSPNYSSGVFCWSAECEAKYAGMDSNPDLKSSSSMSIDIGMSEEAKVPPTISGNTMTDMRDNQQYKLETVAGTLWMAENLKYRTENGSFCENDGKDVCEKGVFYSYGTAQRVCPLGWRLPTEAEVKAADDAKGDSWWIIAGRFKLNDSGEPIEFGLTDGQGYIWIIQSGENTAWRIKAYSGEDAEKAFQKSEGPRAYNVRCVQGEDVE